MSYVVDANLKKALKVRYNKEGLFNAHLRRTPLLAMIKKDNDFSGELLYVPIQTGDITGRSRTFATAQALDATSPTFARWAIDVVPDYATQQISREAVLRTAKGEAFIKLFASATENAIQACDRNLAWSLYRSKGGAKAKIKTGSTVAATDLYLENPADCAFFHVGQTLAAGTTAAMSTLRTGTQAITGIDRKTGILRGASNWSTAITSLANSDYVGISGDATKSISGLEDWCPTTVASSGDSHFGVDRYSEQYLSGYYEAITAGTPPEEHIKTVLNNGAMLLNGEYDTVLTNPLDFSKLEISLLNASMLRREVAPGENAKWGFKGIVISYSGGEVMVYSDPACPKGTFYGVNLGDLRLTFMGPKAGSAIIDDDAEFIRVYNADSYDLRVGNWAQLYTAKPQNICRGTL